jgi:NOL1/NOP2/fmu family ribosome biogenesis protein
MSFCDRFIRSMFNIRNDDVDTDYEQQNQIDIHVARRSISLSSIHRQLIRLKMNSVNVIFTSKINMHVIKLNDTKSKRNISMYIR